MRITPAFRCSLARVALRINWNEVQVACGLSPAVPFAGTWDPRLKEEGCLPGSHSRNSPLVTFRAYEMDWPLVFMADPAPAIR